MEEQGERIISRTMWDLVLSLRNTNDSLEDLLLQERAPLPLFPDVMGIMERPLKPNHRAVELFIRNHPASAHFIALETSQSSDSNQQALPMIVPCLQEESYTTQPSRAHPSLELQLPSKRNTSFSSTLNSNDRAPCNRLGHVDECIKPLLVESSKEHVEYCEDLGGVVPEFHRDIKHFASEKITDTETRCWRHGCNGRRFSTRSNLLRHYVEKGNARPKFTCPTCGAIFSRTSARDQHVRKGSCNRIRRYSNGRERPPLKSMHRPAV